MSRFSFASKLPFRFSLKEFFGSRKRCDRQVRRSALLLEQLESRITPANVSQAGSVLTLSFDNPGEVLAIHATSPTNIQVTTNAGFTVVGTPANFSNTGNTGTIDETALTQIIINDSSEPGGTQIEQLVFNDSGANAFTPDFQITLNQDTPGFNSLVFNGTSKFAGAGSLIASVAGGSIYSAPTSSLTAAGTSSPLTLTASAGNIHLLGQVADTSASGTTALHAPNGFIGAGVGFTGNTTLNSNVITNVSSLQGLAVGQTIALNSSGFGSTLTATIVAIVATAPNTITLSANATATTTQLPFSANNSFAAARRRRPECRRQRQPGDNGRTAARTVDD